MGVYILLKIIMTIKGVLKASRIKILNKPAQWYVTLIGIKHVAKAI